MQPRIDPSRFADPVALSTGWEPLKLSHANFKVRELQRLGPDRMAFKITRVALVFCAAFAGPGALMFLVSVFPSLSNVPEGGSNPVAGVFFGLLFMAFGAALYWFWSRPIVFDRRAGLAWHGHSQDAGSVLVSLDRIHALQLIPKLVRAGEDNRGNDVVGKAFELNLVLADGERTSLVVNIAYGPALVEARLLSEFLQKTLWNAAESG